MAHLIDKDALISKINHHLQFTPEHTNAFIEGEEHAYRTILSFLDTLELKEVDLEKELDTWRHNHFHGRRDKEASGEYLERITQLELAEHFFELGLKAQKGE